MFKVGEKVKISSNNISGIISKIQKNNYTTKYYINVKGKTIILDEDKIEKETSNLNNTSYTPKLDKYTNNIYNCSKQRKIIGLICQCIPVTKSQLIN